MNDLVRSAVPAPVRRPVVWVASAVGAALTRPVVWASTAVRRRLRRPPSPDGCRRGAAPGPLRAAAPSGIITWGIVTWGIVTWGIVTWSLLGLSAAPAAAQIAPDTPRLVSPHGSGGFGVHWVRAETLPGDGDAVLVTWAFPGLPEGVRLRGGAGTGAAGVTAGFGGVDIQAPLLRGEGDTPFDLDWQGGVGVSVGEYAMVTLPVGLSGGLSWTSGSVWLAPYATLGLAADLRLGEEAPGDEFEISPSLDVGVDLSLDARRRAVLRAAASLGDRQAISLGLALGA